jgi:hypothetical protein
LIAAPAWVDEHEADLGKFGPELLVGVLSDLLELRAVDVVADVNSGRNQHLFGADAHAAHVEHFGDTGFLGGELVDPLLLFRLDGLADEQVFVVAGQRRRRR